MKKLSLIFLSVSAVVVMQACHNRVKDTVKEADSTNAHNDTPKKDSSASVANAKFDDDDAKFAVKAASGGLTEVLLGQLAQKRSKNQQIQQFAAMMITDHTKANNELMALAAKKKISLPAVPGNDDQKTIDKLTQTATVDFDKAYVDDMVEDHKNDIKLFEDATQKLSDTSIKAFAVKTLLVLKKHYDAITNIKNSMK